MNEALIIALVESYKRLKEKHADAILMTLETTKQLIILKHQ